MQRRSQEIGIRKKQRRRRDDDAKIKRARNVNKLICWLDEARMVGSSKPAGYRTNNHKRKNQNLSTERSYGRFCYMLLPKYVDFVELVMQHERTDQTPTGYQHIR